MEIEKHEQESEQEMSNPDIGRMLDDIERLQHGLTAMTKERDALKAELADMGNWKTAHAKVCRDLDDQEKIAEELRDELAKEREEHCEMWEYCGVKRIEVKP